MASGNIIIKAGTAGRLIPVEGARVFVTRRNGGSNDSILALRITGRSGTTERVAVETPEKSIAAGPGRGEPFTSVDIRVEHPRYYTYYIKDAQVFADTESIQNVALIPLAIPTGNRSERVTVTPQNL